MKKKKSWKVTVIIILALIVVMMLYAFLGLKKTTNLKIENMALTQISDGTFTGSYNNFRFTNKVEVTVKDHRITNIHSIKAQDGREDINQELVDKILNLQQNDVDAVSGATASSNGFLKAVEAALRNAATEP